MVASEHPEVIEGRRRFISTDVLDSGEAYEDVSIDNNGSALDEEDASVLGEAGVRICVTKSVTEEVEEVQRVLKYSYLSSFMLKPAYLIRQVFKKNKKSQENLFNRMCNFGARA